MLRAYLYSIGIGMFLALGVLVAPPFPARAQQSNPHMDYFVPGEKYPKGLGDFQCFGLSREAASRGKPEFDGWVITDRGDSDHSVIDMKKIRVEGKKLAFTTKSRKGRVFTFEGRFLHSGDFTRFFGKETPVVEGTVRKFRKGKRVAQAKMRFYCAPAN